MKLLFDQNLSSALVARLEDLFPGSTHVKAEGMDEAPDIEVWLFAKQQGFTIVSKDSDFQQRSLLFGAPPKVVWLRVGNCPRWQRQGRSRTQEQRRHPGLGEVSPCRPSSIPKRHVRLPRARLIPES